MIKRFFSNYLFVLSSNPKKRRNFRIELKILIENVYRVHIFQWFFKVKSKNEIATWLNRKVSWNRIQKCLSVINELDETKFGKLLQRISDKAGCQVTIIQCGKDEWKVRLLLSERNDFHIRRNRKVVRRISIIIRSSQIVGRNDRVYVSSMRLSFSQTSEARKRFDFFAKFPRQKSKVSSLFLAKLEILVEFSVDWQTCWLFWRFSEKPSETDSPRRWIFSSFWFSAFLKIILVKKIRICFSAETAVTLH